MKIRLALLFLLAVCTTMTVPAIAGDIYDNGPSNLTTDAWTINFGYVVSDSFLIASSSTTNGANFIFWLRPGDTAPSVDLSIGTSPFATDIANFTGLASTGSTSLGTNQYGYSLEQDSYSFTSTALTAGTTYWITLQNASVPSGDPVYWDESDGPSTAFTNTLSGSIPSESFTILGAGTTGTTPESGSILLFGSGVVGSVGVLRRKLRKSN